MRILYVSHSYPLPDRPLSNVGGMQRVAVDLGSALAAHPDVELTTICLQTSWKWTGVRTGPFLLSLLLRIPRTVRDQRIDVVLFSSMVTASVTPLLRARIQAAGAITAAIPVGRDVTLPTRIYQRIVPRVLRSLDLVLPISRATAAECVARGAAEEGVKVVPCGVDLSTFAIAEEGRASTSSRGRVRELAATDGPKEGRAALLNELAARGIDMPQDALLLLSVGRHQERKGFHWFVEQVMPRLPARYIYLLAGEGPMTNGIRAAVTSRGLGDRVHLLGRTAPELLVRLYRGSDLFIMPNIPIPGDIEGFGVVMLEAGAAGLPVVAAELEGIRDVIAPDRNGTLVPSGDAEGFAAAIAGYAERGRIAEEGARAADYVRDTFGWPSIVESYLGLFRASRSANAQVLEGS